MLDCEVRAAAIEDVPRRVRSAIHSNQPPARSSELDELMTDGCARVLTLETEKLHLGRRISALAAHAEGPGGGGRDPPPLATPPCPCRRGPRAADPSASAGRRQPRQRQPGLDPRAL